MSRITAAITGVAGYLPEDTLTNHDLEKMVDTNDEWIRSRTGIEQRHILKDKTKATSYMCAEAVKLLLKKTNTDPKEIELIIVATVSPDMKLPDTGTLTAHKVGATNAFAFDLAAACSGFLYGLTVGSKFIEAGTHKKVIVIGADKMSSILNYEDRATCIIFGDGAGAVLLEPNEEGMGLQDSYLRGDGGGGEFLRIKNGGSLHPVTPENIGDNEHFVFQDGRTVFKAAVKGMTGSIKEIMKRNDLSIDDIDWLVPHQANKRIIDSVSDMMDFPKELVMMNIQKYGNTTAATLPLCLFDYESRLKKGDNVILAAFGGGYTWGATYLKWGY